MLVHGIDIIDIPRIEEIIKSQRGDRFTKRIYTPAEIECCQGMVQSLAGRFAAKEAVMKALGTGNIGVSWQDIEITANEDGAPVLTLSGGAEAKAKELGIKHITVSISHTREYAVASVIGECDENR